MSTIIHIPHRSEFATGEGGLFPHQVVVYLENLGNIIIEGEETSLDFTDLTNLMGSTIGVIGSLRAEIEELKKEVRDNRSLAL